MDEDDDEQFPGSLTHAEWEQAMADVHALVGMEQP
jgi:hypothetical protein